MKTKEYDYFAFFTKIAGCACEAADYLDSAMRNFQVEKTAEYRNRLHEMEHAADKLKHEMTAKLHHEFITPIEREDIFSLAQTMDDVVDSIEDVMRQIFIYAIPSMRKDALTLSALVVKACHALQAATNEFAVFRKSKTIHEHIVAVNSVESEGDVVQEESLRRLFMPGGEPREQLVWSNVYDQLERCLDACEDAVEIMEGVIMKNT